VTPFSKLIARGKAWSAKAQRLKPVRVAVHYSQARGPLLAGGLSYQSIFAVFAALWVGFAVAGLILKSNPQLQNAFFTTINQYAPGLIEQGKGRGAVQPRQLLEASVLSWTGALAAVGLLLTALGWLASARDAVRALFNLPGEQANFFLLKLRDFGLAVGFSVALLVSAGLSVFSTQAIGTAFGWLGIDGRSPVAVIAVRGAGLGLMLILDTAVLAALFRLLSGLTIPPRRLLAGALLGAVGLGVLKVLGSTLLGGASRNPLLASFAVIVGLLIWFNLVCQVILLTASWIAVGMRDDGLIADPEIAAERRQAEREVEAKTARLQWQQRAGWLSLLFRRRQRTGRKIGRR
jgi:membrane protein